MAHRFCSDRDGTRVPPSRRPHRWLFRLCLAALLLSGCRADESTSHELADALFYPVPDTAFQTPPAPDSILTALEELRTETLRQAFDTLRAYSFTRTSRTYQRSEGKQVRARTTRTVAYAPAGEARVLSTSDSGTFDVGMLTRFAAPDPSSSPLASPAEHMLPDDPAYLSPRNQESYRYLQHRDTLASGLPVAVIEILARPGPGDRQALRRARLWVDEASHQLVGLYLVRRKKTLLFGEESQLLVHLRRSPSGLWLPDTTHIQSTLSFPLVRDLRLETVSSYAYSER